MRGLETISEPKSLNLRPMSFLNYSLRNLFAIGRLDFQPLKWEVSDGKEEKRKVRPINGHAKGFSSELIFLISLIIIEKIMQEGYTESLDVCG